MDPLTVASGVVGVVTATIKVLQTASAYKNKWTHAELNIIALRAKCECVAMALSQIEETLRRRPGIANQLTATDDVAGKTFKSVLGACEITFAVLRAKVEENANISRTDSGEATAVAKAALVWNADVLNALSLNVDGLTSGLNLLVSTLSLKSQFEIQGVLQDQRNSIIIDRIDDDAASLRSYCSRTSVIQNVSSATASTPEQISPPFDLVSLLNFAQDEEDLPTIPRDGLDVSKPSPDIEHPSEETPSPHWDFVRMKHRRALVFELVKSENVYQQNLTILDNLYRETSDVVINEVDQKLLFDNIPELTSEHHALTQGLLNATPGCQRQRVSVALITWTDSAQSNESQEHLAALEAKTTIGKVFLVHFEALRRYYRSYIQSQDRRLSRLRELSELAGSKLWIDECTAASADLTTHRLPDIFTSIALRLMTYLMVLESILKLTPSTHADFDNLRTAYLQTKRAVADLPNGHPVQSPPRRKVP